MRPIAAAVPVRRVFKGSYRHNARRGRGGAGVIGSSGPKYPHDGCADSHGSLCRGGMRHFRTRGALKPEEYDLGGYGVRGPAKSSASGQ
jgi:hypothetical protein